MQCPRCYGTDVSEVGSTHYVCNNSNCVDENGKRTQFKMVIDERIQFPYNQIFNGRKVDEFFKKPYLVID